MNSRLAILAMLAAMTTLGVATACKDAPQAAPAPTPAIDADLMDVTVPRLRQLYADRKYTVTQVVKWHLDRIDRYNPVYGAIETVLRDDALIHMSEPPRPLGNSY